MFGFSLFCLLLLASTRLFPQLATDGDGHYHTYLEFSTAACLFVLGLALTLFALPALVPFEQFHALSSSSFDRDLEGQKRQAGLTEESPLVPMSSPTCPSAVPPSKSLKARRISIRPALVAQIQGEFSSSSDLGGLGESISRSFRSDKKTAFGGRGGELNGEAEAVEAVTPPPLRGRTWPGFVTGGRERKGGRNDFEERGGIYDIQTVNGID